MNLDEIEVIGGPIVLAASHEVDAAEAQLGVRFPTGYREFVTRFGEGVLGGSYVRIFPPWRILDGPDNVYEWREWIADHWFWDVDKESLNPDDANECIMIGDTLDGDQMVIHRRNPERVYILPRHNDEILIAGDGLLFAIEWLCGSGTLTDAFPERRFEPFDSRKRS